MINSDKLIDAMREGNLELHCVEVSIKQKFEGGLSLSGYGILKVNKVGTLYLEFICREASKIPPQSFYSTFPEDPFDSTQKLYLQAVTLEGDTICAEEFSIRINAFNRHPPFRLPILLHEVYVLYPTDYQENTENYLYFELLEKAQVPANKLNSVSSTYGEESYSWDESEIDIGEAKVTVIDKKNKVVVKANGIFDEDELYTILLFYIGLTSGVMPQPYCLIKRTEGNTSLYLKSTNKALRNKQMPAPFPGATSGHGWPGCHYNILKEMQRVKGTNQLRFNSSYSQWVRVWHAFNSEHSIAVLTLGIAIEGLLNDIFIPTLKLVAIDDGFVRVKKELVSELEKIKASDEHRETLIKSVERWGNVHAGKALSMLVEKGVIQESERVAWGELRNSAAHPKFKENTEARQEKEHRRISLCLNLFYRLILNVYAYEGVVFEFGKVRKNDLVKRDYVNILN